MIPDTTDPAAEPAPLRADAVRVAGTTRRGRPCTLIDNTGERLPELELRELLAALIAQDRFGFHAASPAGGSTLLIDQPETAHIQVGAKLYRLILLRYEARIEPF